MSGDIRYCTCIIIIVYARRSYNIIVYAYTTSASGGPGMTRRRDRKHSVGGAVNTSPSSRGGKRVESSRVS